eukprot:Seg1697.12 transcript_id=Seg1697.12/GoldUCD/mRNA.D3Y31 product="Origin recognition complex subunit 2" protein_id=Seg1697.12/GoldUCD/D3Y31
MAETAGYEQLKSEDDLDQDQPKDKEGAVASPRGNGSKVASPNRNQKGGVRNFLETKIGYPVSVYFILGNELCERFSYYGMHAILVLYLTSMLKMDKDQATEVYHAFNMLCYFSPVFGAIIADSFWGKYKTILYISLVYALGNIVVAVTAIPKLLDAVKLAGPMIGLLLIAIGTGGIKPCVSAFGGDQFEAGQEEKLQSFFSIFYFSINVGSLLSMLITPILRDEADELFLIIHNIDGPMLRNSKTQNAISYLATSSKIHIIASIDHINAPIIWDQNRSSRFSWLWYNTTTYERYTEETSFENSLLVQQTGSLALSSLTHVLRSLTPNARGIFKLLVQYQLDNDADTYYTGMSFGDLYQKCREKFLVNSDLTLRAQLTEFKDHKLIKFKKVKMPVNNNGQDVCMSNFALSQISPDVRFETNFTCNN